MSIQHMYAERVPAGSSVGIVRLTSIDLCREFVLGLTDKCGYMQHKKKWSICPISTWLRNQHDEDHTTCPFGWHLSSGYFRETCGALLNVMWATLDTGSPYEVCVCSHTPLVPTKIGRNLYCISAPDDTVTYTDAIVTRVNSVVDAFCAEDNVAFQPPPPPGNPWIADRYGSVIIPPPPPPPPPRRAEEQANAPLAPTYHSGTPALEPPPVGRPIELFPHLYQDGQLRVITEQI